MVAQVDFIHRLKSQNHLVQEITRNSATGKKDPTAFCKVIGLLSLFAFFPLENKSTCGFKGLKFIYLFVADKEQKVRNMRMLIRSPHNSIKSRRLRFTLYGKAFFSNLVPRKNSGNEVEFFQSGKYRTCGQCFSRAPI